MTNPYAPSSGSWSSSSGGEGRWPQGSAGGWIGQEADGRTREDGWGPSTSVSTGSERRGNRPVAEPRRPHRTDDAWSPAGPLPARDQRETKRAERESIRAEPDLAMPKARERGLPWWAALIVLIVIAVIGGVIDTVGSIQVRGGFNIGIVVASVLAILIVRRSHMFPIVIAPPIVYSLAALFQLYLRSGGLNDKKVVFDAAANYLVYGFPAIAAATAAVLIIAGIRLITRR